MTPEEKLFLKYEKSRIFIVGFMPPEFKRLKAWLLSKHLTAITEARDTPAAWQKLDLASFNILMVNVDLFNNHELMALIAESNRFAHTPVMVFSRTPEVYRHSYANRAVRGVFCALPLNVAEVEKRLLALFEEGKLEKSHLGGAVGLFQHYSMGCKAAENGDFTGAKEHLRLALKENPAFYDGYLKMAEVLIGMKDHDAALRVLAKAAQLNPADGRTFYMMGQLELERGNKDAAMENFKKAVALEPRNVHLIMDVGNAFLERNHIDEAVYFFNLAKDQSPEFLYAYNRIGIALSRAGRFGDAEENYQHALKLDENDPGIRFNMGVMWMRQQKNGKAADMFRAALALDPELAEAKEMLAKLG